MIVTNTKVKVICMKAASRPVLLYSNLLTVNTEVNVIFNVFLSLVLYVYQCGIISTTKSTREWGAIVDRID